MIDVTKRAKGLEKVNILPRLPKQYLRREKIMFIKVVEEISSALSCYGVKEKRPQNAGPRQSGSSYIVSYYNQ